MSDTTRTLTPTAPAAPAESPASQASPAPPAPPAPRGLTPAARWAAVLAVVLLGLAVVAGHDAAVAAGWSGGSAWSASAVDAAGTVTPQPWLAAVGVVVALAGLGLVWSALRPRPQRGLPLGSEPYAWVDSSSVERLARAAAEGVDGVVDSRALGTRRRVSVLARTTTTDPTVATDVERAVRDALAGLAPAPEVRVRTRSVGDAS